MGKSTLRRLGQINFLTFKTESLRSSFPSHEGQLQVYKIHIYRKRISKLFSEFEEDQVVKYIKTRGPAREIV